MHRCVALDLGPSLLKQFDLAVEVEEAEVAGGVVAPRRKSCLELGELFREGENANVL